MTAIKIDRFGGLAPSVDPRNLPPEGAQVAENLDLRFGDFRPVRGPSSSVATVPTGTQSIFRTPSGVWLHSATDTDYVNGQVPDAASERVYLTGRSAYPEVWESNEYRRLGVPKPAAPPTVALTAVDEVTQEEAATAQQQATVAVLDAIDLTDTQVWLGNAAPTGTFTAVPDPDALYSQVALHLRFSALTGGQFTDSSPQKQTLTKDAGVTLGSDNLGPLLTPGAGYGVFAGGSTGGLTLAAEIKNTGTGAKWTVDAWVTSSVELEWLTINSRDGNMREILFQRPTGEYHCLTSAFSTGLFYEQLRCKLPAGTSAIPVNTPTLVSVQCTGATVQVFIGGVLCGSTPTALGLEIKNIGKSQWTADRCWQGKIDELRVTLEQRYTGDFTPTAAPFPDAAVPTGFYVAHGDPLAVGLPTTDAGDAAYLAQVTQVGGTYQTTNPADAYLMDGVLGGALVTYSGTRYWAVPLTNFRASGKTVVEATLATALGNVENPAAPPAKLLTAPQAAALATDIFALYNPLAAPTLGYVSAINTAQSELQYQLSVGGTAAQLNNKRATLQTAVGAAEAYFTGIRKESEKVLVAKQATIFASITATAVAQLFETRAYIVTYVTDRGEESQPSDPSKLLDVDQNDAVAVAAASPPAGRNIVAWRLYRSSSSDAGALYKLVDGTGSAAAIQRDGAFFGFSIGTLTFTDDKRQEELQDECETLLWAEPPANLKGLVGLPNGIMAGFFGRTLCFSVPFAPYAWPTQYRLTLEYDIVGLGVFGQTVVVGTTGHPYYASGADSASMSAQKIETPQACIAKRSIVSVEGGVMYASPDGLCLASPNGVSVVTQGTFSKADWQAAVNDAAFAAYHDGCYYLFAS